MATGDIGAQIDLLTPGGSGYSITYGYDAAYGDVHIVVYHNGVTYKVSTVSIDSAGNIGAAWLATLSITGGNFTLGITHISGTVWAVVYTAIQIKIKTIDISLDGLTITELADFDTETGGFLRSLHILHISGTIYAMVNEAPTTLKLRVRTVSISNDGLTISNVALDDDAGAISPAVELNKISGSTYVVARTNTASTRLRTYTISDAGAITFLQETELDTTGGVAFGVRGVNVGGSIWAFSYAIAAGTSGRLRTIPVNADGSFGAVVDTDDTLFTNANGRTPWSVTPVGFGSDVYLYGQGNNSNARVRTVHIAADGTIGVSQDTLLLETATANYVRVYRRAGNIYVCFHAGATVQARIRSFDTETLADPAPGGALMRGSLHRIWTKQLGG